MISIPIKFFGRAKKSCLCRFLFACFCFVSLLLLASVFMPVKSFRLTGLCIMVLIASITYTTDMYLLIHLSTAIFMDTFLFVIICKNLFFLLKIFWICESFLLHENSFEFLLYVRISSFYWKSFKPLNLFFFMTTLLNSFCP